MKFIWDKMPTTQTKCSFNDRIICDKEGTCPGCPVWEYLFDLVTEELEYLWLREKS